MGDDEGGASGGELVQGLSDFDFGLRINVGCRLIEDDDGGSFSNTLAIETRCFCPTESFTPRSPIHVS